MKGKFLIFSLLAAFAANAQVPQKINTWYEYQRFGVDSLQWIPKDTLKIPANYKNYPYVAVKNDTMYTWSNAANKWIQMIGGSSLLPNSLFAPAGTNGKIYYNTLYNAFYGYVNGVWTPFVQTAGQGITNNNGALELGGTLNKQTVILYGGTNNWIRFAAGVEGASFNSAVGYEFGQSGLRIRYNDGGVAPVTPITSYLSAQNLRLDNYSSPSMPGAIPGISLIEGKGFIYDVNDNSIMGGRFAVKGDYTSNNALAVGADIGAFISNPYGRRNSKYSAIGLNVNTINNSQDSTITSVNIGLRIKSVAADTSTIKPYAIYVDSGYTYLGQMAKLNGGLEMKRTPTTTSLTLNDSHYYVAATAVSAVTTITLPAASTCPGRVYIVKKIDSGGYVVSVTPAGSDTIEGASSYSLPVQGNAVTIISSSGTNWEIISHQ